MTFEEQLAHHLTLRPAMPAASDPSVSLADWVQARNALAVWVDHRDRLAVRVKCPEMFPAPVEIQYVPLELPRPKTAQERRAPAKAPVRHWNQVRTYDSDEERTEARRRTYRESKRRAAAEQKEAAE